ncbi:phosphatases II, partial [Sistotremastrum suecicum HHB10207 ss-3]
SQIIPGLYISDLYTATSPVVFRTLGVTHLLSVVPEPQLAPYSSWQNRLIPRSRRLHIRISDTPSAPLSEYLDTTTTFIRNALHDGPRTRVLVHCTWGMSRSASVVIAYLMVAGEMSYEHALEMVRRRRKIVRPNDGFERQVKEWAARKLAQRRD